MKNNKISLSDRFLVISTTASFYDAVASYLLNGYQSRCYLNAYAAGLFELTGKSFWKEILSRDLDVDEFLERIWLEGEELVHEAEELTHSLLDRNISREEFSLWFNSFVDTIDFEAEKGDFIRLALKVVVRNRHQASGEIIQSFAAILNGLDMQVEFRVFAMQMGFFVFSVPGNMGEA